MIMMLARPECMLTDLGYSVTPQPGQIRHTWPLQHHMYRDLMIRDWYNQHGFSTCNEKKCSEGDVRKGPAANLLRGKWANVEFGEYNVGLWSEWNSVVGFIITIASGGEDIKCRLMLMFEILLLLLLTQYCCKYWKNCYAFKLKKK